MNGTPIAVSSTIREYILKYITRLAGVNAPRRATRAARTSSRAPRSGPAYRQRAEGAECACAPLRLLQPLAHLVLPIMHDDGLRIRIGGPDEHEVFPVRRKVIVGMHRVPQKNPGGYRI